MIPRFSQAEFAKISQRVFGRDHVKPCYDAKQVECRRFMCQSANRCMLSVKHIHDQVASAKIKAEKRLRRKKTKKLANKLRGGYSWQRPNKS